MNKEKKQVVTLENLKEIAVMTIAVGIIAAAVYFFLIPLPVERNKRILAGGRRGGR